MQQDLPKNLRHTMSDYFKEQSTFISKFFLILIISTLLGGICGFLMVGFNYLLIILKLGFSFLPYFLSPIIAGALTSLTVKFGMKRNLFRIMGTGAAEFIEEVMAPELSYNRVPVLIGKTLATSWTFGSGILCGKEGPGLLIGANVGHLIASKFRIHDLDIDDYYFIGASACTSAILKTPISGALFCAELPFSNHIRYQSLLPSIFASTIAYLIFCSFFGFQPLIATDITRVETINYVSLLPLLIFFGIFTGIIILFFIGAMTGWMTGLKDKFRGRLGFWSLPLIGGFFYSIFLFIAMPFINEEYHGALIGPDTEFLAFIIKIIERLDWAILLLMVSLFIIIIFLSIGFYNSAGMVFPLMFLGALIGGLFGVIFYPEYPELFVILGISAVLGAAINNPITAIIIIVEMTWEPFLFIPAGIATIIAYIFSGPRTIIPGQREVKTRIKETEID
ncbi:MAG: chloride channel protein [Promethearchaeota archaeon]